MVRASASAAPMLAILLVGLDCAIAYNYCKIRSCDGPIHTACVFRSLGPSAFCQNRLISAGLTEGEKQLVVNVHNSLRQKVASGREIRGNPGPQPAAKNMPNMEWDEELATVAQRWADQCTWGHDTCRDVARFKVGQNIAYLGTTGNVNDLKIEDMIQMWYDEVKYFDKNTVTRFSNRGAGGQSFGHYTQIVWAKSTKIGCGAIKYMDGKLKKFYLVCNYGPAGNFIDQPIYEAL